MRVGNGKKLAQQILRLADDLRKDRTAMTHLDQTHALTVIVDEIGRSLFKHGQRKDPRTRCKIKHPVHERSPNKTCLFLPVAGTEVLPTYSKAQ